MTNTQEKSIIFGANRILRGVPKFAQFIVGLTSFAYLIGWIYARSYYGEFGAIWLIGDIPVSTIIGFSWWPVVLILFFSYLSITDLAEIEQVGEIKDSKRFKITLAILKYGLWVFISIATVKLIYILNNNFVGAQVTSIFLIAIIILLIVSSIEVLAVRLRNPKQEIDLTMFYIAYSVLVFGLYLGTTEMGRYDARNDMNIKYTSLSAVKLKYEQNEQYLVLFVVGDRIYIFPKKQEDSYPLIRIVKYEDIQSIQKDKNRTDDEQSDSESDST